MSISIIAVVIWAFVCVLAIRLSAFTVGGKKMKDAEKELAHLRDALVAKQTEVDQGKRMHEKSLAIAYSVVLDYETLFCEMKKLNQSKRSAVILPFRQSSE